MLGLRVHQWYKNILVFLPLLFVGELFNSAAFGRVTLGFLALCALSSATYIFNDIKDREKDRLHPEKKNRPIAAGLISIPFAFLLGGILLGIGLVLAYLLDPLFLLVVLLLFLLSQAYTLWLKYIRYVDVITLSTNFVLRALSGVFIIFPGEYVRISPWLILVPFFLALFLTTAKRRANVLFLDHAETYNKTLEGYDEATTNFLFSTSTTLLLVFYALFTLFSDYPLLVLTLPVVLFAILYFREEVEKGKKMGRELSYAFFNIPLLMTLLLWSIMALSIIYVL